MFIWLFNRYFPQYCKSDNYVEVRISRTVSEGPFDIEITRVDCSFVTMITPFFYSIEKSFQTCKFVNLNYPPCQYKMPIQN